MAADGFVYGELGMKKSNKLHQFGFTPSLVSNLKHRDLKAGRVNCLIPPNTLCFSSKIYTAQI